MNAVRLLKLVADPREIAEQVTGIIQRQGEGLVRIVDDLLDISSISRGKILLERGRVDLRDVLALALQTSRPTIQAHRHRTEHERFAQPVWIDGDAHRLKQIFANLLVNAAKYTEPGGNISIKLERQGRLAIVGVKDDGAGIMTEMLPRILELYVQVDQSPEQSGGGLGIGVALVKRLAEMHGGRVEAFSEGIGKGSEFAVHLPVLLDRESPTTTSDDALPPWAARLKIILAEDNADAADTMPLLLRNISHEVIVARSDPEALGITCEAKPQVVILDIGLPGIDGYRVRR